MKRFAAAVIAAAVLATVPASQAARVRVERRHARVVVHEGFPIRRTLPDVFIRPPAVAIRVAPRVYLPPIPFAAVTIAAPAPRAPRVWRDTSTIDREDGWTDVSLNVDQRGRKLFLNIDRGAAQISFAEVVFENGETQVIDFNDHVHASGYYSLLDLRDPRRIDHVRIVAKADRDNTRIGLQLGG